ncbi:nitrite reductase small subunit NirD [Pseudazoarcus pumilus]|uniref:Nitrite reductase (NAD(P)H) small subunit n=1 Tax=Pseudazoarcus pumilus TaxID=2067960 RepID=A0A2I6S4B7_9RHOO|nr:nitrite reductase small subunit NirD [Pseudazoarcus pumilus]AUN94106.1 nitrite reductase (NAD(P)H) small subunit [Pseudazoarcus pumilus]
MNMPLPQSATTWRRVCALDDIPVLGARTLEHPTHGAIAVFRNGDDEVFALSDRCPHKGGPLSAGIVHGRSVTCPLHNWRIGLEDGHAAEPDEGCTARFDARVEDGHVLLLL